MADQRCVDYIRANKDKYPIDSLKEVLAKAGVPAADIEEAVRAATQQPSPPAFSPAPPVPPPAPAVAGVSSLEAGLSSLVAAASSAVGPALQKASAAAAALTAAPPAGASAGSSPYSHPDSPVRHSYPLLVADDGFFAAMNLCLKTLPLMGLRLGLMVAFTVAAIVWFLLILFMASAAGRISGALGFWMIPLMGIAAPAGLFRWFKRYFLFLLEMAQVAVITRLITHGDLDGKDQIAYGKEAVMARFGEVNLLLVLQGLITGVVGSFMRTVDWLTGLLPLPGLDGLMNSVNQIMRYATRYVDDAIFSYNLARGDENQWRSSKDGLIYYAQNWKPVIKTAVIAFILEHVLSFLAFWVLLVPCWAIGSHIPHLGGWVILMTIAFAVNFKSAVLRPLFSTMVMLSYHKAVQNQPINAEMDQTLTQASDKFRELAERARNWASGQAKPETAKPAVA